MRGKHIIYIIIAILLISVVISSCGSKRDTSYPNVGYSYACQFFDIPEKEGYEIHQIQVFLDNPNYCVVAGYDKKDSKTMGWEQVTDIFTVDAKGSILSTLEMEGIQIPQGIYQNCYVYVGYSLEDLSELNTGKISINDLTSRVVFIDRKSGELDSIVELPSEAFSFIPLEDGFAILSEDYISKYSKERQQVKTISTGDIGIASDFGSFSLFQESGKYYLHGIADGVETVYYEVDFTSGGFRRIVGEKEISVMGQYAGPYMFDDKGEYKINLSSLQVKTLARFSEVDVRPPKKGYKRVRFVPMDDTHFAKTYEYSDGTAEILLFAYDSSIDYSGREKITIGGYNLKESAALDWAIYNFNKSNQEYRAVLVDYSEQFGFEDPADAQKQKLALLKYFSEGNAPDIFFGYYFFDFEYMGRNGMLLDMQPFISGDGAFEFDSFSPSIQNLLKKPDHVYQLFPSYWINGQIGLRNVWEGNTEVSISSLYDKASEMGSTPYHQTAVEIVKEALQYDFYTIWSAYRNDPKMLRKDMQQLLDIALYIGEPAFIGASSDEYLNEMVLLQPAILSSLPVFARLEASYGKSNVFIGYPSLRGSAHLLNPEDLVAISNTTRHADICWEIIRQMFSRETQELLAAYGSIPVNDDVLHELCLCAADHDSISEGPIRNAMKNQDPIEEWIIDDYLQAICSVDTIITYDWGVADIIRDEVESYYSQNRSINQITDTLISRLNLYYEEIYE